MMKLGARGKALLEDVEGRRNVAYLDTAGKWTTGIGHLIKPDEQWMITTPLTDQQVDDLFSRDIAWAEEATRKMFPSVTLQNQFDALVSFVFNLGEPAVRNGSLPGLINSGKSPQEISAKWRQYVYSGGVKTPGLVTRRFKELRLYFAHLAVAVGLFFVLAVLALAGATAYAVSYG